MLQLRNQMLGIVWCGLCIQRIAIMKSKKFEKMVKCPFNPSHIMVESSLQRHVIRCMVNYPNYVVCPYNALHRFRDKNLLQEHMMTCDSKKIRIEMDHDVKQETCYHIDHIRKFNLEFENWDED